MSDGKLSAERLHDIREQCDHTNEDVCDLLGHIAAVEDDFMEELARCETTKSEQQAEIARLREVLGRIADPPVCSAGCDVIARAALGLLDDGFGSVWQKCDKLDCELEIVRPGKVQCNKCEYPDATQATP